MNFELISVVMPCFNSANTIVESINSVLSQTYKNFELIVVDDYSTDDSVNIVEEIAAKDTRVKLIQNQLWKGASGARQTAINASLGMFIAFLDSDDLWHEDKLAICISFLTKHRLKFIYTDYYMFSHDVEKKVIYRTPVKITYKDLLKFCPIGCLTVILHRELLEDVKFREESKEDYLLWLDILRTGVIAYRADGCLSFYRIGSSTLSSNKLAEIKKQFNIIYRLHEVSLFNSVIYIIHYGIKGLVKNLNFKLKAKLK